MCPFCLASAALIAGSATGTCGLTAIVTGTIFKKRGRKRFLEQTREAEVKDVNRGDRCKATESGLAR